MVEACVKRMRTGHKVARSPGKVRMRGMFVWLRWLLPFLLLAGLLAWRAGTDDREEKPAQKVSRRAVIFGIDGIRSDALKLAVESGRAPHIAGLITEGAVTWSAMFGGWSAAPEDPTRQPTNSGPGWSSVLTGVWTDKHGVTGNNFEGRRFDVYPPLFQRLHEVMPEAETASLVSWSEINTYISSHGPGAELCACLSYTDGDYSQRDSELTAKTLELLSEGNPDLVFHYQGGVDAAGHGFGFSPDVPEYMASIEEVDARIGEVLAAVRARPGFSGEDWLFIVTSDHGGIGKGHGGHTPEERIIPFVAAGGSIPRGLISDQVIGQVAVPATVFRHLGLGIPAGWGWSADGFGNGTNLDAVRSDGKVLLVWSRPARGFTGCEGYEIRRDGELVASLGQNATEWTDDSPGEGARVYGLTAKGSGEGEWTLRVAAPDAR